MPDKVKILYLAANPLDNNPLRLQEEARDLQERIQQGLYRECFEILNYFAVRPRDLLRGLQEVQPHIIHFSGHGNCYNQIVLQNDAGKSIPIEPEHLAQLVEQHKSNIRIALLNCCYGRQQAEALNRVLDYTIGIDKPISDLGAISFSATFYQVLASGGSVIQAFESARLVTNMEGRPVFQECDLLVREEAKGELNKPFIETLKINYLKQTSKSSSSSIQNNVSQTNQDSPDAIMNGIAGNNNSVFIIKS